MIMALSIPLAGLFLAATVSCAAVVVDLRRRQIPNGLTAGLVTIGIICAAMERGWAGLADAWAGAAIAFGVFLIPYLLGGMGGGDVKLMAAFGALTGLHGILPCMLLVATAGAMTSLLFLGFCRLGRKAPKSAIPYAPAIVIGGLMVAVSEVGRR